MGRHRSLASLEVGNRIRGHLTRIRRYYDPALTGPRAVDDSGITGRWSTDPVAWTSSRHAAIPCTTCTTAAAVEPSTLEVEVRPVLNDAALERLAQHVEERLRLAVQRGMTVTLVPEDTPGENTSRV